MASGTWDSSPQARPFIGSSCDSSFGPRSAPLCLRQLSLSQPQGPLTTNVPQAHSLLMRSSPAWYPLLLATHLLGNFHEPRCPKGVWDGRSSSKPRLGHPAVLLGASLCVQANFCSSCLPGPGSLLLIIKPALPTPQHTDPRAH